MTEGAADRTLLELLAERSRAAPASIAVRDDDDAVTYAELATRSDRVAGAVVEQLGVGSEPVGVLVPVGVDAIVAILGVVKAGKIALPLDDDAPAAEVEQALAHAGARLVVTDDLLRSVRDAPVELSPVDPGDPAVLFTTSGSTGTPKAFAIPHGAQGRAVGSWIRHYGLTPDDRVAMLFHHSFGASRVSMFGALASGAELRVYAPRRVDTASLATAVEADGITVAHTSASLLRSLLGQLPEGANYPAMRLLAVGAEGMHPRDIERFRRHVAPTCTLVYTYATSETGPVSALFVDATMPLGEGPLPVGSPFPGKRVRIESPDAHGIGEIVIAGDGLALGYWRDEVQTAQHFSPDPDDPGSVEFRPGDRGRLRPDGMLEHHGRTGTLVKVRGYSVDLVEVERAILAVAPVAEAAVTLHQGRRARLVAYVAPEVGAAVDPAAVRAALAQQLASYKVPAAVVVLDALPRTARGKVDPGALPPPPGGRPPMATPFAAPEDELHQAVAGVWEEVLDLRPIGIHDDFGELGGDSLAAVEIVTELNRSLSREVPLATFVDAATVAQMADVLRRGVEPELDTALVALHAHGSRPPIFCVHGGGGNVLVFRSLADELSAEQPFYAFQLAGASALHALGHVERLAAVYVEELRRQHPTGPFVLAGFSFGGAVAFEMARRLERAGDPPALVVILDTTAPHLVHQRHANQRLHRRVLRWAKLTARQALWSSLRRTEPGRAMLRRVGGPDWHWFNRLTQRSMGRYHPGTYRGDVLVLSTAHKSWAPDLGWSRYVEGEVAVLPVDGTHQSFLTLPEVRSAADRLDEVLAGLDPVAAR
jgi:acyl-coenzyme A synthetase/AMP-(fatty) acid ligase/thioesterase domain-containing protein